jgi:hypothetical protein
VAAADGPGPGRGGLPGAAPGAGAGRGGGGPGAAAARGRAARALDALLAACFLAGLALPVADGVLGLEAAPALLENRALAAAPRAPTSRRRLEAFPRAFEAYWNDHFGFRRTLIRWANGAALALGASERVVVGRAGWLFLRDDGELAYYRAREPLAPAALARWQYALEHRRDWLAARGSRYLFAVAPNKSTVYAEFMPPGLRRPGAPSRLDQLLAQLRQGGSTVAVLDLREPVLAAKAREPVFPRTDTHWNAPGAHAAAAAILARVGAWLPGVAPLPREAYAARLTPGPGGDLAYLLGLADRLPEAALDLVPPRPLLARPVLREGGTDPAHWQRLVLETPDRTRPRALVLHDSFVVGLMPYLSEPFSRVVYSWGSDLDLALAERERPDVVIEVRVERHLMLRPP